MNLPRYVDHYINSCQAGLADSRYAPMEVLEWLIDNEDDQQLLVELAQEQLLPYGIATWLADHDDVVVRASLALNWTIDPGVIARLADEHEDDEVRKAAAQNYGATPETLQRLAEDQSPLVRMGVAWNQTFPTEVLAQLENNDENPIVRSEARRTRTYWEVFVRPEEEQLAEVESTTDATALERHSRSPHASVRKAVLSHAATPAATAKDLTLGDTDQSVQVHGAQWVGATKAVLKELAEDDQQPQDVRVAAISNQRIPRAVLERLTGHADPIIASEAGKALESRP